MTIVFINRMNIHLNMIKKNDIKVKIRQDQIDFACFSFESTKMSREENLSFQKSLSIYKNDKLDLCKSIAIINSR